ncbi:isoleucine--tRNA ligase [Mycoplasma sp. SG1]|uniref:isoleucine--tRNA ligase n=1 Tax=Mycoplasma sp. SG1 TaxID=2810348 RepID=UPI0020247975|nr:isoleucine--tRNA ligase [Mycoplasma sp. SG1]URM53179.1 isoleucine--tRNA ligase [Mycoplasma sp. SG1]
MDYFKTLNIFTSPVNQKAKLVELEARIAQYYQKINFQELLKSKTTSRKEYTLLDGPPYANGDIHIGHALNKVLKDIILRYQLLNNKKINYLPGWDCHGLPIEQKVKDNLKSETFSLEQFFSSSYCYVEKQIQNQKEQFLKLGLLSDFSKYYQTIDQKYISYELDFFKILVQQKLIYRDLRPIYWSWSSKTVLSDAEVEYLNKPSHSLFFLVKISNFRFKNEAVSFLVWTTTPWSLLGNQGLAVNDKIKYCLVKDDKFGYFIINKNLITSNPLFQSYQTKIIKDIAIKDILTFSYHHPIDRKIYKVYLSHHVVENEGTGIVHIAPGHGEDDYSLAKKHKLNIFSVIDDHGFIHYPDSHFHALFYEKASLEILKHLETNKTLFLSKTINHSYPHDWRTKKPVVYLVKEQWFIDINKVKDQILDTIKKINFFAPLGQNKLLNMIKERQSWCISRQRKWGLPIPILFTKNKTQAILDLDVISEIIEVIKEKGILFWFNNKIEDILSSKTLKQLKVKYKDLEKETDILDVWFDSGIAFLFLLFSLNSKTNLDIDLILEGNDQFRGWFNSSLITSTIWNKTNSKTQINFKNILSHGFVLDSKGHKMSKSLKNIIAPETFLKENGVDILRLWSASVDFLVDIRLGDEITKVIKNDYQKIRNTLRFLITNLVDFDYKSDLVTEFEEVDTYILFNLKNLKDLYQTNMQNFAFNSNLKLLKNFLSTTLSAFYLNFAKDIIYIENKDSLRRRQIQTVFFYILDHFLLFLAPILSLTAEEFYQVFQKEDKKETIFLETFANLRLPQVSINEQKWDNFILFKKELNKALEEAKNNQIIKVWQEAEIEVIFKDQKFNQIQSIDNLSQILTVREIFFKSEADLNDKFINVSNCYFYIKNSQKIKCLRCWKYFKASEMVGEICQSCHKVIK